MKTTSIISSLTGDITTRVPAVAIEQTGDRQVNGLQETIARATAQARSVSPEGEVLFEDVELAANTSKILAHRLGRAYREWSVSRVRLGTGGSQPVSIIEIAQNSTELDGVNLTIQANTACKVNIRVR